VLFLICRVLGADAGQGVDSAVAEPVAGAFQGEYVGVVDDAVDHGCGGCRFPKRHVLFSKEISTNCPIGHFGETHRRVGLGLDASSRSRPALSLHRYGNERHEGHLHPNLSTEGALHAEWVKAASGTPVNEPGPPWPLGENSQGNGARPGVVPDPAAGWCP
jgi:hypothetical protein